MKFMYCSVCGRQFIRPAEPLYRVNKNGRVCIQCSNTCWKIAKGMNYEDFIWLSRMRRKDTFLAKELKENQDLWLNEGDSYIVEFEGYRWLALTRFISTMFFTYKETEDGGDIVWARDLHWVQDNVQITYISDILNRKTQSTKIEDILQEYSCRALSNS